MYTYLFYLYFFIVCFVLLGFQIEKNVYESVKNNKRKNYYNKSLKEVLPRPSNRHKLRYTKGTTQSVFCCFCVCIYVRVKEYSPMLRAFLAAVRYFFLYPYCF